MAKITKSPLVSIYGKRYLLNIDMDNISEDLRSKIDETFTPSSKTISSKFRNISLSEAPDNTIEYIAFECNRCTEELKMLSQIEYMIRSYSNDTYTKQEIITQFQEWYPSVYGIEVTLDF